MSSSFGSSKSSSSVIDCDPVIDCPMSMECVWDGEQWNVTATCAEPLCFTFSTCPKVPGTFVGEQYVVPCECV
jgi:hypothetical protein